MALAPETRNEQESSALDVLKRIVKGKGMRQGVFYIALNSSSSTVGQVASLICLRFERDKTGTRTLQAGKKLKKDLSANQILRGSVSFDKATGGLKFEAMYKKGNLKLIKKKLMVDLKKRATTNPPDSEDYDKTTAKKLQILIRKAQFADSSGEADEETDVDLTDVETAGAKLTTKDFEALGINPKEKEQLTALESAFANKFESLNEALKGIMQASNDDVEDEDAAIAAARAKAKSDLETLQAKLKKYDTAHLEQAQREEIEDLVKTQIKRVMAMESGKNPFTGGEDGVIAQTEQIMLKIAEAQAAHAKALKGERTAGMETEYTSAKAYVNPMELFKCPVCKKFKNEPCRVSRSTKKKDLVNGLHKERAQLAMLSDHTHLFKLTLKNDVGDRKAGDVVCEWHFETQGQGDNVRGTMEAVSSPWVMGKATDRRIVKWLVDVIDKVQAAITKRGMTAAEVETAARALFDDETKQNVTFERDNTPEGMRFNQNPNRSPQFTFTTSLDTMQDVFREGLPAVQNPSTQKKNNAMLEDSANDADDLFAALVPGGEVTEEIGLKLKGFLSLLAQWLVAQAISEKAKWKKIGNPPKKRFVCKIKRHGKSKKHTDEELQRTWYWQKDAFPLIHKTPLALLCTDGGLTPEEEDLLVTKKDELLDAIDTVLGRYDLDRTCKPGLRKNATIAQFVTSLVTQGPGGDPDERGDGKCPIKWPLSLYFSAKTSYNDWDIYDAEAFDQWQPKYEARFMEWHDKAKLDDEPFPGHDCFAWAHYWTWRERVTEEWGEGIGDTTASVIDQFDGGSRRVANEIRQMTGSKTSKQLVARVSGRLAKVDKNKATANLSETLDL